MAAASRSDAVSPFGSGARLHEIAGSEMAQTSERLVEELQEKARKIRIHVVRMAALSDTHVGGSFSIAEITAALYFHILRVDRQKPDWNGRDYPILSKGHMVPAVYAAIAERGCFPVEELAASKKLDRRLGGHATTKTPGIDLSTGSLGFGKCSD